MNPNDVFYVDENAFNRAQIQTAIYKGVLSVLNIKKPKMPKKEKIKKDVKSSIIESPEEPETIPQAWNPHTKKNMTGEETNKKCLEEVRKQ